MPEAFVPPDDHAVTCVTTSEYRAADDALAAILPQVPRRPECAGARPRYDRLRARGQSYREIAAALNWEDHLPLPPCGTWHPTTVRKVLLREG